MIFEMFIEYLDKVMRYLWAIFKVTHFIENNYNIT